MKKRVMTRIFTPIFSAVVALVTITANAKADGLSDFNRLGNANWTVSESVIQADQGSGFLVTKESYDDFYLKVEFRAGLKTNSGIFFRCESPDHVSDKTCFEANIYDTQANPAFRTGALVGYVAPKVSLSVEDGQFHTYEIFAVGEQLRILLDGHETAYARNRTRLSGPIALQLGMGQIEFRNLEIKPLPGDALAATPSKLDGVWELESMFSIDASGQATPWCAGSFGIIIYTKGHMSTAVNCPSDASKTIFYSGPFLIDGPTVYHHAQNYSSPGLHKVFSRTYRLKDENHLELSGQLGEGKVIVNWIRR